MRVVVWNCEGNLEPSLDQLDALRPDIAIVSECHHSMGLAARPGVTRVPRAEPSIKSLALFAFGDWAVDPIDDCLVEWVVPARVSGPIDFTLLGLWPVKNPGDGRPGYEAQVAQAIAHYRRTLVSGAAILAGDFNGDARITGGRGTRHLRNIAELYSAQMVSAYHEAKASAQGEEEHATLFMNHIRNRRFHCDFCFVPASWRRAIIDVDVGSFDDWVATGRSDHVPITVTIDHTLIGGAVSP